MKAYGGVDVYIHIFLTLALAGGEWSASCPGDVEWDGFKWRRWIRYEYEENGRGLFQVINSSKSMAGLLKTTKNLTYLSGAQPTTDLPESSRFT
jgi:hypothetical protein